MAPTTLPCPRPITLRAMSRPDLDPTTHRNFDCEHYHDCLEEAVSAGWPSWSCSACALFAVRADPTAKAAQQAMRRVA